MSHLPDDVNLFQAKQALQENSRLISADTHKVMWNLNVALLHICDALDRTRRDVELLHNKLQPIIKELSGEKEDVRRLTRGA